MGASTVKVVALSADGTLAFCQNTTHHGRLTQKLLELLREVSGNMRGSSCVGVCLTGESRGVIDEEMCPHVASIPCAPALSLGSRMVAPEAGTIIEVGAQNVIVATDLHNATPTFLQNGSCAGGTGAFFEDQMTRLGLPIDAYSNLASEAQSIPRLSGRCSVFAKSDIIHRQQEGVPTPDILLGLAHAMVRTLKAMIVRGHKLEAPVYLSGGVAQNRAVVQAMGQVFTDEDEMVVAPNFRYLLALGAAHYALKQMQKSEACAKHINAVINLEKLMQQIEQREAESDALPRLAPLASFAIAPAKDPCKAVIDTKELLPCYVGIDVGSTSTNIVLMGENQQLLHAVYLRTKGEPEQVVREGLVQLAKELSLELRVLGVATTGSGRKLVGELVGADEVIDEITCQARAASQADDQVDTVFEIGGQDSKFISLNNGEVTDFQMNKICAAGTGSFVEEQAARMGLTAQECGQAALRAKHPVDLGERCTVFMETSINAAMACGAEVDDIAAGLCLSVIHNYVHRVVGSKHVGEHIVLQGGVAYNQGIVAAFRSVFGDRIQVSPWFSVSGAYGAALIAQERMDGRSSTFKGFDLARKVDILQQNNDERIAANRAYYHKTSELFLKDYDPVIDPNKKTIGVPRCLVLYKFFLMANGFFHKLGYNVILSDPSSEEIVQASQAYTQADVCYSVKLAHGHVANLLDKGVDYIFMPSVHTIKHSHTLSPHNYACPFLQTAPMLISHALDLEKRGVKLLSPQLDMDLGQASMATAMLEVGGSLGATPRESALAMLAGSQAINEYMQKTEELGDELLNSLEPNERVIVLVTRNYGIADPVLNMGIPDILLDHGQKVITISHLHAFDVDLSAEYGGVCWPFGQHILSAAKIIRRDPRLYPVFLTAHGCGPDTMIDYLFKSEMGDKPCLHIEVDEHFSAVGVVTRIEAFLNSLNHCEEVDESALPYVLRPVDVRKVKLCETRPVRIPDVGWHSRLVAAWLRGCGYDAGVAPMNQRAFEQGREISSAKEYLSFVALAGASLAAVEDKPSSQILVPSTEGAEADCLYPRVIRTLLDERGKQDAPVAGPAMNRLDEYCANFDGLVLALLAADVVYAMPASLRDPVAHDCEEKLAAGELSLEGLCSMAANVSDGFEEEDSVRSRLAIVGEWPLVFSDELTDGIWSHLESEGIRLLRMPFTEYLWLLLHDSVDDDTEAKAKAESSPEKDKVVAAAEARIKTHCCSEEENCDGCVSATNLFNRKVALLSLEHAMDCISHALGKASTFALNREALLNSADEELHSFAGGNGRYRVAKAATANSQLKQKITGVVQVASMYENASAVIDDVQQNHPLPLPLCNLSFDSEVTQNVSDKLEAFLYCCK